MTTAVINGKTVSWGSNDGGATGAPVSAQAAAPASSAAANAPAPAPAPAAPASGAGSATGSSSGAVNTGYMTSGNSGSGAITKVDSTDGHAYTMTIVSKASSTRKMYVWNKVGSDGQPNSGATQGTPTLQFELAPGASQVIAFQANTQGALCDFTNGILASSNNIFVCPWLEFNYAPTTPTGPGWSAYDVSMIQANLNGGAGGACNVECSAPGTSASTSTCTENMYYSASQPDGIGGTVSTTTEAHFQTTISD